MSNGPDEELERQQAHRLAALRRFVLARSPFYQRFHRGLERQPLQALPVLTKATMMEDFDDLVTDRSVRLADAEAFLRERSRRRAVPGPLRRPRDVGKHRSSRRLSVRSRGMADRVGDDHAGRWRGPVCAAGFVRPPRLAMVASTTPWHYSTRVTASLSSRLLPTLRLDAAEPLADDRAAVERVAARGADGLSLGAQAAGRRTARRHAPDSAAARLPRAPRYCPRRRDDACNRRGICESSTRTAPLNTHRYPRSAPTAASTVRGRSHHRSRR